MTSRYGYVDDEKLTKENILIVQLSPFTETLQLNWLSKYQQFHPDTWLTELSLKNFNIEHRYSHIKELVEQPLLLHMIASVKGEINENTNRAQIYNQLFSELIDRKYAKEGQLEVFKNIDKENLRNLIREVAFSIYKTGNEYITKVDLMKLNATQSFLKLLPDVNFRDSIKGVMISFYFKETEKVIKNEEDDDKSNYAIEFLHKSLREYMTAEKIFYTIKDEFLDKKSSGKYVVDDAKSSLAIINDIFGKQNLSDEIRYHLREIVNNDTDLNKENLTERMCLFLSEFVLTDFIIEYRMEYDKNCIDISLRCFYGFWYFISCLGLKKNYLINSKIKQRIAEYLRLISNSRLFVISSFDFSCQDFSNEALSNVTFYSCKFSDTNFSKCDLDEVAFNFSKLSHVNFNDAFLQSTSFPSCVVKKCSFVDSFFLNVSISNSKLEDLNFAQSLIQEISINEYPYYPIKNKDSMKIINCSFLNARIDKKSIASISNWYDELKTQSYVVWEQNEEDDSEDGNEDVENDELKNEDSAPNNYKRILTN